PRGSYTAGFGHHSNAGWRGTKADIHEGGHRVPFLVSWPAKVKANKVLDTLVELTDIYATLAEVTGAGPVEPVEESSGMDSLSFLGALTQTHSPVRSFAVHHSLHGTFALRQGDWKLIEGRGSGGFTKPRDGREFSDSISGQLYHLSVDPGETTNRWEVETDRVTEMNHLLERVRATSARSTHAPE
ncbi:MAG: arylsulfatase, partial [Verrucomicrobiales bacterium]